MDFFTSWLTHTWGMLLEAAPWLVGGFFVAGVVYVLLPADKVVKHLGRPGLGSILKAALVGVPLPLCSCSVIPVASSLRQRGASRGATASFLISTPESGADSIGVSYALLGPFMAIVRPLAAFITATAAGLLISARGETDDPPTPATEASCPHCATRAAPAAPRLSLAAKLRQAAHHGFVVMFANLAHWLLLGFLLGGLVSAFIPAGFFERAIGTGIVPLLLMLVAGLPLYVCATSATPLAAALIAKGLSPGAALVFMLVGPATNMTTMLVVARDLGRKSLFLYIGTIAVVAVLLGLVVDALPTAWVLAGLTAGHAHAHASAAAWPFAVLLLALLLNGLRVRLGLRLPQFGQSGQTPCCSDNLAREEPAHSDG